MEKEENKRNIQLRKKNKFTNYVDLHFGSLKEKKKNDAVMGRTKYEIHFFFVQFFAFFFSQTKIISNMNYE